MTTDELADAFTALFAEAHARVDALGEGPVKNRAERRLNAAHWAMESFQEHCADHGLVKPFDGTNKPPPGP